MTNMNAHKPLIYIMSEDKDCFSIHIDAESPVRPGARTPAVMILTYFAWMFKFGHHRIHDLINE